MVLIALGSNLFSPQFGSPRDICEAALARLSGLREEGGNITLTITARSRWYESAPVPASDQPWFVNGVVAVETGLGPAELLTCLHGIESEFGRIRRVRNESRVLDMDLLAYGNTVLSGEGGLHLPHPRLVERAFVLLPLRDIAPDWRHPQSGEPLSALIKRLPAEQDIRPLS